MKNLIGKCMANPATPDLRLAVFALALGLLVGGPQALAGGDITNVTSYGTWMGAQYTAFSNMGSIVNTRHNMMQNTLTTNSYSCFDSDGNPDACPGSGGKMTLAGGTIMGTYRNDYGEVCVYCHTPHGADTKINAPLWNRKILTTTYQTYNTLGTSSVKESYAQPGAASLACLSCHDGLQAVDAIINMPGSGRYNPAPSSAEGLSGDLYRRWSPGNYYQASQQHGSLSTDVTTAQSCLFCHSPSATSMAVDFTVAAIGTDLRNDHPVGVTYPTTNGTGTDWKTPNGIVTRGTYTTTFFDENINTRMDKTEIRMYDSGNGASVECASCHDPHGVPSAGMGSRFNPTFLRKTNQGSAVCLTCHVK